MKNKTHPHHKLINEWCMDMETELEEYSDTDKEGVSIDTVLNDTYGNRKFRIKPREFAEGEWYPCLCHLGSKQFLVYEEGGFKLNKGALIGSNRSLFKWIGESLGKVNFPE